MSNALKTGLLVLGGVLAMFVLLTMIGKQNYSSRNTYVVHADFKDATGLSQKSRVQIAGIEVGIVDHIDLTDDARARIYLRIKNEAKLYSDARVTKRAVSLLGDFLLDVFPGTPGQKQLKDGDEVPRVVNTPGMEDVFGALGDVARDIQGVVKSVQRLLDSDGEGSVRDILKGMDSVAHGLNRTIDMAGGRLDSILGDAQKLAGVVRNLVVNQQGNVGTIIGNVRVFTEQANRVLSSIGEIIGNGSGQLKESVSGIKDTLAMMQKALTHATDAIDAAKGTIDSAHDIVNRIDRGEGTIGKLVRDDGIAVKLDKTLGDVNSIIAPISELQLKVQVRDELHWRPNLPSSANSPQGKAALQVILQPRPDKFYGFELVSEPRGNVHSTTTSTIDTMTGVTYNSLQTLTTTNDLKYSAYMGKRFGPLALRVGLIESSGGGGTDLYLWNDRLRFTVDAFDFSDPVAPYPRLRASANISLFEHIFLGLGGDDLLNSPPMKNGVINLSASNGVFAYGRDGFATAGIQFTDDDLKALLTLTGIPKP